jgi:hypothetical protein
MSAVVSGAGSLRQGVCAGSAGRLSVFGTRVASVTPVFARGGAGVQPGSATRRRVNAVTMSSTQGQVRWNRTIIWPPVWTIVAAAWNTR